MIRSKTLQLLALISLANFSGLRSQNFTWQRGSNTFYSPGSYGTPGTALPGNDPCHRSDAAKWTDASGNLWLYGGFMYGSNGNGGDISDMWKYDPATGMWTLVSGSSALGVQAVYGTKGMANPANTPGARDGAMTWQDASGNLWLFGGAGYGNSSIVLPLNDLWKYNIAANEWTWVSGDNVGGSSGTYGTMGTAAPLNIPGGRFFGCAWYDAGNLWLFGGQGPIGSGFMFFYNDVWKYNIATNLWTWVSGTNVVNAAGAYGTQSVPSTVNIPGSRSLSAGFKDTSGNLWLFGGTGSDGNVNYPVLFNDVWKYSIASNQWTWVKGSNQPGAAGSYGSLGVASVLNTPDARKSMANWADAAGNLWIFGGTASTNSPVNDLWKYNTLTNQWTWMKGSNTGVQPAAYGTQGLASPSNIPGARMGATSWQGSMAGSVWLFGGLGLGSSGNISSAGSINDLWHLSTCTSQTLSVTGPKTNICSGEIATLSASGAGTYSWSNGAATGLVSVEPHVTTTYTVTSTDANACNNFTVFTIVVDACTAIKSNEGSAHGPLLYPNPAKKEFNVSLGTMAQNSRLVVMNSLGQKVVEQDLDIGVNPVKTDLATGLYFYSIVKSGHVIGNGKLIID